MTEETKKHSSIFFQPKSSMDTITSNDIKEEDWVPLEDLNESDIDNEDGDMIIEQRLLVNNKSALQRLTEDIKLKGYPLIETMSFTSTKPIKIMDVFDDLEREKAFEQQALEAAIMARKVCKKAKVIFANRKELKDQSILTVKENNKKQKNQESERIKLLKRKRKDTDADDTIIDEDIEMDDYQDNSLKSSQKGMKIMLRKKNRMVNNVNNTPRQGKGSKKSNNKKSSRPGKAKRQAMRNKK